MWLLIAFVGCCYALQAPGNRLMHQPCRLCNKDGWYHRGRSIPLTTHNSATSINTERQTTNDNATPESPAMAVLMGCSSSNTVCPDDFISAVDLMAKEGIQWRNVPLDLRDQLVTRFLMQVAPKIPDSSFVEVLWNLFVRPQITPELSLNARRLLVSAIEARAGTLDINGFVTASHVLRRMKMGRDKLFSQSLVNALVSRAHEIFVSQSACEMVQYLVTLTMYDLKWINLPVEARNLFFSRVWQQSDELTHQTFIDLTHSFVRMHLSWADIPIEFQAHFLDRANLITCGAISTVLEHIGPNLSSNHTQNTHVSPDFDPLYLTEVCINTDNSLLRNQVALQLCITLSDIKQDLPSIPFDEKQATILQRNAVQTAIVAARFYQLLQLSQSTMRKSRLTSAQSAFMKCILDHLVNPFFAPEFLVDTFRILAYRNTRFDYLDPPSQALLIQKLENVVREMTLQQVAMTLWAMGRISINWLALPITLREELLRRLLSGLGDENPMQPVYFSNSMFGLGKMHCTIEPDSMRETFKSHVMQYLQKFSQQLNPQSVSGILIPLTFMNFQWKEIAPNFRQRLHDLVRDESSDSRYVASNFMVLSCIFEFLHSTRAPLEELPIGFVRSCVTISNNITEGLVQAQFPEVFEPTGKLVCGNTESHNVFKRLHDLLDSFKKDRKLKIETKAAGEQTAVRLQSHRIRELLLGHYSLLDEIPWNELKILANRLSNMENLNPLVVKHLLDAIFNKGKLRWEMVDSDLQASLSRVIGGVYLKDQLVYVPFLLHSLRKLKVTWSDLPRQNSRALEGTLRQSISLVGSKGVINILRGLVAIGVNKYELESVTLAAFSAAVERIGRQLASRDVSIIVCSLAEMKLTWEWIPDTLNINLLGRFWNSVVLDDAEMGRMFQAMNSLVSNWEELPALLRYRVLCTVAVRVNDNAAAALLESDEPLRDASKLLRSFRSPLDLAPLAVPSFYTERTVANTSDWDCFVAPLKMLRMRTSYGTLDKEENSLVQQILRNFKERVKEAPISLCLDVLGVLGARSVSYHELQFFHASVLDDTVRKIISSPDLTAAEIELIIGSLAAMRYPYLSIPVVQRDMMFGHVVKGLQNLNVERLMLLLKSLALLNERISPENQILLGQAFEILIEAEPPTPLQMAQLLSYLASVKMSFKSLPQSFMQLLYSSMQHVAENTDAEKNEARGTYKSRLPLIWFVGALQEMNTPLMDVDPRTQASLLSAIPSDGAPEYFSDLMHRLLKLPSRDSPAPDMPSEWPRLQSLYRSAMRVARVSEVYPIRFMRKHEILSFYKALDVTERELANVNSHYVVTVLRVMTAHGFRWRRSSTHLRRAVIRLLDVHMTNATPRDVASVLSFLSNLGVTWSADLPSHLTHHLWEGFLSLSQGKAVVTCLWALSRMKLVRADMSYADQKRMIEMLQTHTESMMPKEMTKTLGALSKIGFTWQECPDKITDIVNIHIWSFYEYLPQRAYATSLSQLLQYASQMGMSWETTEPATRRRIVEAVHRFLGLQEPDSKLLQHRTHAHSHLHSPTNLLHFYSTLLAGTSQHQPVR